MKLAKFSTVFLRLALASTFLSAVASRLNIWGKRASLSQAWSRFIDYTAEVNSFLPKNIIPPIALAATVLETGFALLLLFGYKTYYAALGAGVLLLLFGLAMTYSFGIKEPLDYSVFTASAGAFILASASPYKYSSDQLLL